MLTTSHAQWTAVLTSGQPHCAWSILGGVLPDLTATAVAARERLRGTPGHEVLDRTYHRSPWREIHMAAHAVWGPGLIAVGAPRASRRRALAGGWAGHLGVDLVTHHSDAWPPAWPLSPWRWPAPVSHWEQDHHSRPYGAMDLAGLALTVGRRPTLLGTVAVAVAAASLVVQFRAPSRPLGLVADPAGRARDLARSVSARSEPKSELGSRSV